jgi:hypothetical protein
VVVCGYEGLDSRNLSAAVLLLGFGLVSTDRQEALQQSDVVFEGLNAEYGSCDPLRFTAVRNISQTKIYVEVYAEESKSGEWGDAESLVPMHYSM